VIAGFLLSLTAVLLALVDFRRGFLFSTYPARSLFYAFNPWQVALFAVGAVGMFVSYRALATREATKRNAAHDLKILTFAILGLLIVDLFTYRGVPASRSIASGRINVDWLQAFGATGASRPFAQATSYLLNVWHATLLGILISGLALTVLPVYFAPYFVRTGFSGSLLGALFALPQPFCSCCSSVMAPSFARRGASTNFLLSFVVGAPMLNVTTIVLAVALLPAPFAVTRIVAGVVVSVFVTYVVARIDQRWAGTAEVRLKADAPYREDAAGASQSERQYGASGFLTAVPSAEAISRTFSDFFLKLLDIDRIVGARAVDTPSRLIAAWLRASGRIALILVPTLWLWSVVAAALFQILPPAFGNNLPSVVLAAVGGTLFMISTWSEIPMALQFIQAGFSGPAAALLVVLPAISLPCMMLLGGSLQRFRMVALLCAAVMLVGIAAGVIFL
jgi:uncharacterized membrane protein YraQ (UPF0718 family)